jgi:hypothetical protein
MYFATSKREICQFLFSYPYFLLNCEFKYKSLLKEKNVSEILLREWNLFIIKIIDKDNFFVCNVQVIIAFEYILYLE